MRATKLFLPYLVLTSVIVVSSSAAFAKINVNLQVAHFDPNGDVEYPCFSGMELWDTTTGTKIHNYYGNVDEEELHESVDAIAMGPDGYLYAAGNDLGQIFVEPYDTATGLPTWALDPPPANAGTYFSFFGGPVYTMSFDRHGDLFTGATDHMLGMGGLAAIVRRFDGETGGLKGELSLGDNRYIRGLDFADNGESFYVMHRGQGGQEIATYSYSPLHNAFTETGSFSVGADNFDLWVGPDGLLYLSQETGTVDRYTLAGSFVDQFIDENVYDLTHIQGKLLGLVGNSKVVEINPLTGEIVQTLIDAASYAGPGTIQFYGMAAFSVPEPSAICLALSSLVMFLGLSRHRPDAG